MEAFLDRVDLWELSRWRLKPNWAQNFLGGLGISWDFSWGIFLGWSSWCCLFVEPESGAV